MMELGGLYFPEALRWHDGALWFSDMFDSRVVRWVPGAAAETVIDRDSGCPDMPGGLGWLPADPDQDGDATLLVVDCLGKRVLAFQDGRVSVHAELGEYFPFPANDMHVDADGTAWVGGYGFDPESDAPRESALLQVAVDGTVQPTTELFVFPNGCERDSSGALVVAETFADRLSIVGGSQLRSTIELASGSGPDGISITEDGTIYVALAFARQLVAVDPTTARANGARAARVVYAPEPITDESGAGALACYDCAVEPGGRRIAIAIASADEALAERVPTGRIVLLDLTAGRR